MTFIRRKSGLCLGLPVAMALLLIAGCGVSEPSAEPWRDVARFSWPRDTTAVLEYQIKNIEYGQVTSEKFIKLRARASSERYNGLSMYELEQSDRGPALWMRYATSADTLVTRNGSFPADIALTTPLVKGHSWVCGYNGNISWRATIIERYAWRKVDGKVYQNVVEVEYRPEQEQVQEWWVRLYAEGLGPIQTVKNFNPNPERTQTPIEERTILISSSVDNGTSE